MKRIDIWQPGPRAWETHQYIRCTCDCVILVTIVSDLPEVLITCPQCECRRMVHRTGPRRHAAKRAAHRRRRALNPYLDSP